jgi:hypothetical protein
MGMTREEARAKVGGLIREATEFSILATQLFSLCEASNEDTNEALPPLVKLFAKAHELTETEAWTLLEAVTAHLATEPWAYIVLAPRHHKCDADIGRYLQLEPASNREIELALERGLEKHSFDANSKQEILQ